MVDLSIVMLVYQRVCSTSSTCFLYRCTTRASKVVFQKAPRCAVPAFFSDPFPGLHPVLEAMGQHLAFGAEVALAGGLGARKAPRVPPVTVDLHW